MQKVMQLFEQNSINELNNLLATEEWVIKSITPVDRTVAYVVLESVKGFSAESVINDIDEIVKVIEKERNDHIGGYPRLSADYYVTELLNQILKYVEDKKEEINKYRGENDYGNRESNSYQE